MGVSFSVVVAESFLKGDGKELLVSESTSMMIALAIQENIPLLDKEDVQRY